MYFALYILNNLVKHICVKAFYTKNQLNYSWSKYYTPSIQRDKTVKINTEAVWIVALVVVVSVTVKKIGYRHYVSRRRNQTKEKKV